MHDIYVEMDGASVTWVILVILILLTHNISQPAPDNPMHVLAIL